MKFFSDFFSNYVLTVALAAWMLAQVMKFFVAWVADGRPDVSRLFGDGGMPSAHSATVTAMAVMAGYTVGFSSPLFGVAFVMAIIVMHDATGVRRETGKQSRLLIEIVATLNSVISEKDAIVRRQKLKTMVGHTPMQVFFGAIFGLLVVALFILIFSVPYCVYN